MRLATSAKLCLNQVLRHVNLRLETLTADKAEVVRLQRLNEKGHFDKPVFVVPQCILEFDPTDLLTSVSAYASEIDQLKSKTLNRVDYEFENGYYSSPDAEVLYAIVRKFEPRKITEIGCGNSTKIFRQAIGDGCLTTQLVCVDPNPRVEIGALADSVYRDRVENLQNQDLFRDLEANDILFIDSSHKVETGNDVQFLFLTVLPQLRPGVLIHIHDIFLPYEYPNRWIIEERWGFNEQYLLQALLSWSSEFEILWAGHFLQRTQPEIRHYFPHWREQDAKSLWLRRKSPSLV